jgi:crotonobetainyl-CoA:carnitine CoA-transferase CaiB-like acyl-CoA transferase
MSGILAGMRVIEGSAFVAAPLGGMTLAQISTGSSIRCLNTSTR